MRGVRSFVLVAAVALLAIVALPSDPDGPDLITEASAAVPPDVLRAIAEAEIGMPPARIPRNAVVTCVPPNAFNPDAGLGQVLVGSGNTAGYAVVNAENESATAAYFCWRTGTTKANYTTVCRKRCNGCAGGIAYNAEITNAGLDLFCIAGTSTDAGITVAVEVAQ